MKKLIVFAALLVIAASLLTSCAGEPEYKELSSLENGGFSFTFLGGGDGVIKRIYVYKDGNAVCALGTANGTSPVVVDLNFDGYGDLRLDLDGKPGYCQCFLYQPTLGIFVYCPEFETLLSPVAVPEKQELQCRVYSKIYVSDSLNGYDLSYREARGQSVWKWNAGLLTEVYESGIEYFSDSTLFCVYEAKTVNGKLTRDGGDEHWFYSADDLAAAGYVWED